MHDSDWQAEIDLLRERERKARALLGVSDTAGPADIRRAFRHVSRRVHPDVNGGGPDAARRFHLVRCAYRCLTSGEACGPLDELDVPETPPGSPASGDYRQDNPWGYWCWWRDKFFEQSG